MSLNDYKFDPKKIPDCPVCGSPYTSTCKPGCALAGPLQAIRDLKVRVVTSDLKDPSESYLNASDIYNLIGAYIEMVKVANGPLNPVTVLAVQVGYSMRSMICASAYEGSPTRILATDINTSVPDTIPEEWLQ